MKKTTIRQYARLIAVKGANVQKGQEVLITAELDQPEFVSYVVTECYKLGAKKVNVDWSYQPLEKLSVKYQSTKTLCTIEDWQMKKLEHLSPNTKFMYWIEGFLKSRVRAEKFAEITERIDNGEELSYEEITEELTRGIYR